MPTLSDFVRSQLSIQWRLAVLVAALAAGVVLVSAQHWFAQQRDRETIRSLAALDERLDQTRQLEDAVDSLRFWQLATLSGTARSAIPDSVLQARIDAAAEDVGTVLGTLAGWSPKQARDLRREVQVLAQERDAAALAPPLQAAAPYTLWQTHQQSLHDYLAQRTADGRAATQVTLRSLEDDSRLSLLAAFWVAAVLIALMILAALVVIRSILRPLHETARAVGELAAGRLDTPLPAPQGDEIGAIGEALHRVRDNARRLEHLAFHDPLTGLPNHASMKEALRIETERVRETGYCLVLMYVNLDQLETINEIYGPATGDSYLQLAAERLTASVPDGAQIFHLAGAKFAVIVGNLVNDAELTVKADSAARAVLSGIGQLWQVHQQDIDMSATIGVVTCPQDGINYEELALNASATLTHARRRGTNGYQFYTRSLTEKARSRLALATALRRALQEEEFTVHYQPIVDVHTGVIIAGEGLVRWQHPERGLVYPGEFIGVAEETGAINALGEWTLAQGAVDHRTWRKSGLASTRLALNLSTRQLTEAGLVAFVEKTVERTGLPPSSLELEITESAMMVHPERSIRVLRHLKALGVSLAVDDFGTGYSSLAYLQRFPLDKIKIDRSFISRLHRPKDAAIVTATTQLATTLGLTVVAEGVETHEQMTTLMQMGCRYMQGYLFAKSLPVDDFVQWAHNGGVTRTLPRLVVTQ